ncbi:peptidase M24, structural domain-containing protein [Chytriomyces sp. MP71]|nr:peptidase M24, structural domain-containing protein [Chytriomyces sp. MP71]
MVYIELETDYISLHRSCRTKVFTAFKEVGTGGIALFKGGEESFRHDTDHEHLFRQESHFHYLFGVNEPNLYGALDFNTGLSYLFVPRLDVEYEVWCGKVQSNEAYAAKYGIDRVHYVDELATVLQGLVGARVKHEGEVTTTTTTKGTGAIHILSGTNSDSKRAIVTVDMDFTKGKFAPVVDVSLLFKVMVEARAIKTDEELVVLRHVNRLSSLAHINVMRQVKPGMHEFQLESLFLSYCSFEGGCRYSAYTCICGTGANGAILHYGHAAAPNNKQIRDGDMCLLDMGSEFHCYASDITCSYPANGRFTTRQRGIYTAVLNALVAVRNNLREGVEWVDMHLLAERKIVEGLVEVGIVHLSEGTTVQDAIDAEVGALFFPHGLGHMMGMDTHDCGGYPEGRERINRPGLRSLRMNRVLKAGMVLTNEPGCYFIEALLRPALENPKQACFLNRELVLSYLNFGGVRLEEDLIITEQGVENMTQVPREIEEIEQLMAGGKGF